METQAGGDLSQCLPEADGEVAESGGWDTQPVRQMNKRCHGQAASHSNPTLGPWGARTSRGWTSACVKWAA